MQINLVDRAYCWVETVKHQFITKGFVGVGKRKQLIMSYT